MTQEKKVIRVLKPTKKAKKTSPMLFGIIGTAFGVIATSVLLFTFLKEGSNSTAIQTQNNQSVESIQTVANEMPTETLTTQSNSQTMTTQSVKQTTEETIDDEHAGFNQPQPKLNEINQAFQHKKETPVAVVAEAKPSGNPFDTFNPQPKPVTAAVSKPKPHIPEKALAVKATTPVQSTAKATVKTEQIAAKTAAKEPLKTKTAEKEADYEVPHATVQIAVTRTVKD